MILDELLVQQTANLLQFYTTAFTHYNLSQMVPGLCVMVWRKRKRKQEKKERQRRKMRVIYDHGGQ